MKGHNHKCRVQTFIRNGKIGCLSLDIERWVRAVAGKRRQLRVKLYTRVERATGRQRKRRLTREDMLILQSFFEINDFNCFFYQKFVKRITGGIISKFTEFIPIFEFYPSNS